MLHRSIKRVLMCRPLFFEVDYIINPWMKPHSINHKAAMTQWEGLVKALEKTGVKVDIIDQKPGLPDMVFATDHAFVKDKTALIANFRYPQRQRERTHYIDWFTKHGFKLKYLSDVYYYEGGDGVMVGDMFMVGAGFRASVTSCEEMSQILNMDVVPLRLVDPAFYHLDMCFFPINKDIAFYYPEAFSENSRNLLKKLIPRLIPFTKKEAESFCANSYITGDYVITQRGNASFIRQLKELGVRPVELDMSEFYKSGGGIHCLINTLN